MLKFKTKQLLNNYQFPVRANYTIDQIVKEEQELFYSFPLSPKSINFETVLKSGFPEFRGQIPPPPSIRYGSPPPHPLNSEWL